MITLIVVAVASVEVAELSLCENGGAGSMLVKSLIWTVSI